ncbi:MAG TPA: hypothetical protein DEQ47_16035 [Solibacterales bacterium]|nr:hypothetical protein [Bryobacterales bacterium]
MTCSLRDFSFVDAPVSGWVENARNETFGTEVRYPQAVQLISLNFGNRTFRLAQPLDLHVEYDRNWVVIESEILSIMAGADNLPDAIRSFAEDFSMLWDTIAEESDEGLSGDARSLKLQLRSIVRDVAQGA